MSNCYKCLSWHAKKPDEQNRHYFVLQDLQKPYLWIAFTERLVLVYWLMVD